eukprot:TRINITY_DN2713_c0_g1_i3.p1 TRINITY_DN2713_c0_g1~~TRINITY_DN2713_c0_g1_i3.p1  ORF type:complete len:567 (-),score=81.37 TRINITY_DN2713_c0_g1_i3:128-1828(-)
MKVEATARPLQKPLEGDQELPASPKTIRKLAEIGKHKGSKRELNLKKGLQATKDSQRTFGSRLKRIQRSMYLPFEEPGSSRWARLVQTILITCVIISCVKVVCETVEEWTFMQAKFFIILEFILSIVFLIEYIARLLSATAFGDSLTSFLIRPLNILDLISALPFFIELALNSQQSPEGQIVRTLRLSRIVRIFKFSRYLKGMSFLTQGISRSFQSLSYLGILILIANLIFATLAFYAEEANPESRSIDSSLHSIPDAMWWSLVTMTTVGFGDKVPTTVLGKLIAVVTGVTGMLIIAIPVAILGNNFQQVYMANVEESLIERKKDEALASTSRLTEEQQEIFFMNIRLKLIEDNNKEMTSLLARSDKLYKAVTRDLKDLSRSVNRAAMKDESRGTEEAMSRGRFVQRMIRAKQKIKVTNLFQKLGSAKKESENSPISPLKEHWKSMFDRGRNLRSNALDIVVTPEPKQVKRAPAFRIRSNSLGSENPFIKFRNEKLKNVRLADLNDVLMELDERNAWVEIEAKKELPKNGRRGSLNTAQVNLGINPSPTVSFRHIKRSVTRNGVPE